MADPLSPKVVKATATRRLASPNRAGAAGALQLTDAVRACIEYAKISQAEKTERARIKAKRDVAVAAIHAQKDVILRYFDLRFKEREAALSRFFVQLDEGIRARDDKLLDLALHGIVGIIKDNPLSDFEAFRQQMAKPDFLLDL